LTSAELKKITHGNTNKTIWPDLTLVGEGLVIRPIHDARVERVAGNVLNLSADGECTAGRSKERMG